MIRVYKRFGRQENLGILDNYASGSSICTALSWDSTGQILYMPKNSSIWCFACKEKNTKTYDIEIRDVGIVVWSSGPLSSTPLVWALEKALLLFDFVGT